MVERWWRDIGKTVATLWRLCVHTVAIAHHRAQGALRRKERGQAGTGQAAGAGAQATGRAAEGPPR
ncbi:TPA: hypothetical protein NJV73_004838 [Escherichia coli]|nr:hypothetical protein [Escherichia coli]HCG3101909.1 hypothetical protein [Escherichia coli]